MTYNVIYLIPEYFVVQLVHYHSGGLRLNPNLYESGKVCLSLLNTWTGSGTEVWDPKSSTVLQVLLSLQALVLNDKPYFNEAGYDKQIGRADGEKNSITYNENAFLLSCKSMMYVIQKPPKVISFLLFRLLRNHIQCFIIVANNTPKIRELVFGPVAKAVLCMQEVVSSKPGWGIPCEPPTFPKKKKLLQFASCNKSVIQI